MSLLSLDSLSLFAENDSSVDLTEISFLVVVVGADPLPVAVSFHAAPCTTLPVQAVSDRIALVLGLVPAVLTDPVAVHGCEVTRCVCFDMRRIILDDQTEHAVDLIFRERCRVVHVHWQEQESNVLITIEVEVFGVVRVDARRANVLRIVLSFEEIVGDEAKRRNCCQD